MVNTGKPSRACGTCKARHIKCDEAQPICQRCRKARRTCLGYRDGLDLVFRDQSGRFGTPNQRSVWMPAASFPLSSDAVNVFFSDYVLESQNRSVSRGYLDGLGELLLNTGPDSLLAHTVEAVAVANVGKRTGDHKMLQEAEMIYGQSLHQFRQALSIDPSGDESLMTATLLGLYESITASHENFENWVIHLRGVSAMLCTVHPLFDVGMGLFQTANPAFSQPVKTRQGLLASMCCAPTDPATKNLDHLLIRIRPLLVNAALILTKTKSTLQDLRDLRQQARLLNSELSLWPLSQPPEWKFQTIGHLEGPISVDDLKRSDTFPGRVDVYYDLYVAGVWNTFRKARLKLLDVLFKCGARLHPESDHFEDTIECNHIRKETAGIADDICASVPFHLIGNLQAVMEDSGRNTTPAKALGGFMLIYPLHIASLLSLVPEDQRRWIKGRLRWIGKMMGIAQATILAEDPTIESHDFIGDAHLLQWAGCLIQPPSKSPSDSTARHNH